MKINKHGLPMNGLKKASGATCDYGYYAQEYDEIFYDRSTGEIWTEAEVREVFEQCRDEMEQFGSFDEYMTDRLHNGWMEEVRA